MEATKPKFRLIAGRPASNAPEGDHVDSAVKFMDRAALVFFALLALLGIWAVTVLLFALNRVAS